MDIVADSQLYRILEVTWCRINSLHHQAVQKTGQGIEIVARDRDGLVQGIESREHDFLIGVQWHPEWLIFNRPQQRLIRALVDAARRHRVRRPAAQTADAGST